MITIATESPPAGPLVCNANKFILVGIANDVKRSEDRAPGAVRARLTHVVTNPRPPLRPAGCLVAAWLVRSGVQSSIEGHGPSGRVAQTAAWTRRAEARWHIGDHL